MKNNETYFNFPIKLLEGFMSGSTTVLNNILGYAVYEHFLKMECGNKEERLIDCEEYYGITLGDRNYFYVIGKELYENNECLVKVGINLAMYWDFHDNYKTDFEKICLLGHLAIKSILGNKPYCRVTMKYWLARMDGKSKSCEFSELSESLKKYSQRHHYTKLKLELQNNWNLVEYSYHTRGFYVGFKLNLEKLIYEVEKRRKSRQNKELGEAKKQARFDAINKLEIRTP